MSFRNRGVMRKGFEEVGFDVESRVIFSKDDLSMQSDISPKIQETAVEYILRMAKRDRSYEKYSSPKVSGGLIVRVKSVFHEVISFFNKINKSKSEGESASLVEDPQKIAIENAKRMYEQRKNIPKFKSKRRPRKDESL